MVVFTQQWINPREKSPLYPLNRRLDGPQSPFGDFEEGKKLSFFLSGVEDSSVVRWWTVHFIDGAAAATVIKDRFIY